MLKEFKDIVPGMSLGDYIVIPTKTQLFMFSAVTWNRHKIHFDKDQAESEGFSDVAVQRGLIGNFLAIYVTQWILHHGYLKNLQWKVLQSTFPNQELKCLGEVVSVSEGRDDMEIHCDLRVVNEVGELIAKGAARLQCNSGKGVEIYG